MTAKIATALHEVMSKVGYIQKTGKNTFHGYKYAGEADLLDKLRPAMVEAGLMLLPSVKSVSPVDDHGNVTVQMEYTLIHKDGDVWPVTLGAAGMGNDRAKNGSVGDKGVYKAITGANKYVLFKLFQIETGDDPESASDHDQDINGPPARASTPNTVTGPPRKANGKPEKGWREDGTRTAYALKTEQPGMWAEFDRELMECQTVSLLTKLALDWSLKAETDKWPFEWRNLAKEEINKRKVVLLNSAPDDDEFPGDLPANRNNIISTLQAGE